LDTFQRGKYYVTVAGAKKLERELEEAERKRGEVAGNIRTAKAYGDLSENFEYHEAKREQGFLEGRIQQLKQILPSLAVIAPEEVPADHVSFGSVVTVREDTGDEWELLIVGPLEADPMADRISYESPLGAALLSHKVGDVVDAQVPAGTVRYEITGIHTYDAASLE
jgi:transcription elongation factor GreA